MRYLASLLVTMALCAPMVGHSVDQPAQQHFAAAQVEGNNAFAFDLFASLKSGKGNLFFSPYSISSALAMTATGAAGATRDEMNKVLHLSGDPAAMSASFSNLNKQLVTKNKKNGQLPLLLLANGIWIQKGYSILPAFIENLDKNFHTSVNSADFEHNANQGREAINAWVAEKTLNKITGLFPVNSLDQNTRLVLASAIYMQAKWKQLFENTATEQKPFYLTKDQKVTIEMMNHTATYPVLVNDQVAMVEIPYAYESKDDPQLAMVVLLPMHPEGISTLENLFRLNQVKGWMELMELHDVHLSLPKFKIEFDMALRDTLTEMGMVQAFTDKADFKLINHAKNLSIDKVFHKAYIAVDEKGSEAAAATAVSIGLRNIRVLSEPYHFLADHPFLFIIMDKKTGSILFIGRLSNP